MLDSSRCAGREMGQGTLPVTARTVQYKPVDFRGKAALITGANRGIGRGCALELAGRGANVVINYRSHAEEAAEVDRGQGAAPWTKGRREATIAGWN